MVGIQHQADLVLVAWSKISERSIVAFVKALLRIAVVWNIPIACNRASADFMISSTLMSSAYQRLPPNYETYIKRSIGVE